MSINCTVTRNGYLGYYYTICIHTQTFFKTFDQFCRMAHIYIYFIPVFVSIPHTKLLFDFIEIGNSA